MQVALDFGTVDIRDKEVVRFIQNTNIDEIKMMFINFLKHQIQKPQESDSLDAELKNLQIIHPQKTKQVKEALDSLNHKLESIRDVDIDLVKDSYIKEKFSL